jgi:hypothetical protein
MEGKAFNMEGKLPIVALAKTLFRIDIYKHKNLHI